MKDCEKKLFFLVNTFENDISTWIDDSPEKGGKAWISPFKEDAIEYIKYFASEIDASDFDYVIACDIEFPFMRNTDLNYLGASVKSENRYLALQNVWYEFKNVFVSGDKVILDVSAYKIVTGGEEVFSKSKPTKVDCNCICAALCGKDKEKSAEINNV